MRKALERAATEAALFFIVMFGAAGLCGCTQIEQQFGGKLLGASVTVAGVTVALSGTIPAAAGSVSAGENSSDQVAKSDPPGAK